MTIKKMHENLESLDKSLIEIAVKSDDKPPSSRTALEVWRIRMRNQVATSAGTIARINQRKRR